MTEKQFYLLGILVSQQLGWFIPLRYRCHPIYVRKWLLKPATAKLQGNHSKIILIPSVSAH